MCFDGDVPHNQEFRSRYLPDPSWTPGKTNTIWSSVAFGHQATKDLLHSGLCGINPAEHKVYDVSRLAASLIHFMNKKVEFKHIDMFGWKKFWMEPIQRKQVACEVAKIVFDNLGRLTFAELHP